MSKLIVDKKDVQYIQKYLKELYNMVSHSHMCSSEPALLYAIQNGLIDAVSLVGGLEFIEEIEAVEENDE